MLHLMKYQFKQMTREISVMFWALFFPIILGTLFYFAFGNGIKSEEFSAITVAVVKDSQENEVFTEYLKSLDGDILNIKKLSAKDAKKGLIDGKIKGIFYAADEPSLTVTTSGLEESILKTVLDSYVKHAAMIGEIIAEHPENLIPALNSLEDYHSLTKEVSLGGKTLDNFIQYFFALIAMACLYGCFLGMKNALEIQANLSQLGARRSITPVHRMKLVVSDILVTFGVHFANVIILLLYLNIILKIEFGNQWKYILPICFVGSMIGVAMGLFVGSIGKMSENVKMGMLIGISMLCSFLAGLMVGNMKDIIERNAPIINRINPAALISDAFYSITVYDDMSRYYRNLGTMIVMSLVLVVGSFLMVRRERYDSI